MARITITKFVGQPNFMRSVDDEPRARAERSRGLVPYEICLVAVCGFTFVFHSLAQLETCIDYYARPVRPSRRLPVYTQNLGGDHWEAQRWHDRLPLYLLEKSKRPKVVTALQRAHARYRQHPSARTRALVTPPPLPAASGRS